MFGCPAAQQATSSLYKLKIIVISYMIRLEKQQRAVVGTAISCCRVKFCEKTNGQQPMLRVEPADDCIPTRFASTWLAAAVQGCNSGRQTPLDPSMQCISR